MSAVHPAGPGRLLVAHGTQLDIRRISSPETVERVVAELELPSGWRLNDGILDAKGTVWIGVVAPSEAEERGWLARVSPNGKVYRAVEDVRLSNGIALSADGSQLYHADSRRRVVWRHRLSQDGNVIKSAEFIRLPADDGMPDGVCLDQAGRLWVAIYGKGEVRCYSGPDGVEVTIAIDPPQSTSLWIGGHDGRDLIITSAREGYDESARQAQPLAGTTFQSKLPPW